GHRKVDERPRLVAKEVWVRRRRAAEDVERDTRLRAGGTHAVEALVGRPQVRDRAGGREDLLDRVELAALADADIARRVGAAVLRLLVGALQDADDAPGAVVVDAAAGAWGKDDGDDEVLPGRVGVEQVAAGAAIAGPRVCLRERPAAVHPAPQVRRDARAALVVVIGRADDGRDVGDQRLESVLSHARLPPSVQSYTREAGF